MKAKINASLLGTSILCAAGAASAQTTVTIATVNNSDMVVMQELSDAYEEANPDVELEWVILEENALRQQLTTDIATNGGQYKTC